jgi:hypothetical protein
MRYPSHINNSARKSVRALYYRTSITTATGHWKCITAVGVGVLLAADSRPVRLGIGPPFGILDQILSCSSSFV